MSPDAYIWSDTRASDLRLWRSLETLHDSDALQRQSDPEFSEPAAIAGIDRRAALRLLTGAAALTGMTGCSSSARFGAPLRSQPRGHAGVLPGDPVSYATSLELDGSGRGVVVRTTDGRPIGIEGNPEHPASLGAIDIFAQAELLALYDPSRSQVPHRDGTPRSWQELRSMLAAVRLQIAEGHGKGLAILTAPSASPTLSRVMSRLAASLPEARLFASKPIADDNVREGSVLAFGRPLDLIYDLSQADVIVSLGADLIGFGPMQVRHAADFAQRRRRGLEIGRLPLLVAAEISPGLTGARADLRLARKPSEMEPLARALVAALGTPAYGDPATHGPHVQPIAKQLLAAGPRALVAAGRDQPAVVHALAHAMNARLGAIGTTVRLIEPRGGAAQGDLQALKELAEAIAAGNVTHLLVLDGNPVYDGPADLPLSDLIRRVPFSLHVGLTRDETARVCRWHVPQRHAFESWGDTRAFDGTAALRQPVVEPLEDGTSPLELVGQIAGEAADAHAHVQATWRERWGADFEARWLAALDSGVVAGTAAPTAAVSLRADWDRDIASPPQSSSTGLSLHFIPDASVWDGRYAGNAWLQELPDPLTKQVWGNTARIAPVTAARLGVTNGNVVEIESGGRRLEVPLWITPGQAHDTLSLPLGYGRPDAGALGSGVGANAYALRTAAQPWAVDGVSVRKTGRRADLASTQHHHTMEGRDIVRVLSPGAPPLPAPRPLASLYSEYPYEGHAWGMSIDLDSCFGCNACVIACQSENNVAVVGPQEVRRGREMHWLRIDRYYAGDPEAPATYFQPVLCMHCEKAPCEVVCPVNATVHSSEGLNDMVYNRCIGTRTCSNNCPYKVRRFNWFDYARRGTAPPGGTPNPDVTVRPLGVMEKCTYCTQRITAARIAASIDGRMVRDGEIQTACQQACPTRAITFGDINDAASSVSRAKSGARNYALLGELNTQPRTTYLARVGPLPIEA